MSTLDLKPHFRRFLEAQPNRLHFAAHSHHLWPDVTFEAQQQAWLDAAMHADDKWDQVFGSVLPEAQRHIAEELGLSSPGTLVFAPNTHEFVLRLLSCLPENAKVVTSDSEFHSFERQTRRLEESGLRVTRVASEPFATFPQRLVEAAKRERPELLFVSHVFFNSGAVVQNLNEWIAEVPAETMIVLDGYHGFCAVPTDVRALEDRCFYVSGGYKYAMAGEGACFLHVPKQVELRPRNTGWFAAFGALEEKIQGRVPYSPGAMRFMGATFDPSGLYRLNAVMRWRKAIGLTTAATRVHAHELQRRFVHGLRSKRFSVEQLVVSVTDGARGQFLTFRTADARNISADLKKQHVITDAREDRFRVGFGVYQTAADVDALLARLG